MIDVESSIFNAIAKAIRAKYKSKYPNLMVVGEYMSAPTKFPCISIEESDNQAYDRTATSENPENHAYVLYEVNVYSNATSGKKYICKELIGAVDEEFKKYGFRRITLMPVPNLADATIYRMTARYRAVVTKDNNTITVYRR